MNSFKIILSIFLSISLSSCSKLDEMGENAEGAKENSGRAAIAAEESREEIANGRMISRTSGASASRRKALKSLGEMESFSAKVTEASKFVQAFEFQYWTGQRYDTEDYLEALYTDAMREFFRSLMELNGDESIAKTNPSIFSFWKSVREKNMNISAIAVAMHKMSNVQTLVTVPRIDSQPKSLSVYELIKRALKNIELVENGELNFSDLREYEEIVYNYRDEALAITQARLNMFLTMALMESTELKDYTTTLPLVSKGAPIFSYDSNFDKLNLGEQHRVNDYLDAALKVKVFLEELNKDILYDEKLVYLYEKLNLSHLNLSLRNSSSSQKAPQEQIQSYLYYLDNFEI